MYEEYKYELTEDFSDRRLQMEARAAQRRSSGTGVGSHMSMERDDGAIGPRGSSLGRAVVGDADYSRLLADAEESSVNTHRDGSDETETSRYNADLLPPGGSTTANAGDVGIAIISGTGNTIGGTAAGARNIISNNFEGIEINSNDNVVQGNYIGTDITGTLDRGNRSDDGVEIRNSATGNLIGGTAEGAVKLLRQIGADVVAACFIIDLPELGGAAKLRAMDVSVRTLMTFDGH